MKKYLNIVVVLISIATIASGLLQVAAPGFVLNIIGAEISLTSKHFFAIVGMFMALFGGAMLHAVYSAVTSRVVVLWCAFQKIGAFIAVSIGIVVGVFSVLAGAVAFFDLFSGILFLIYWKSIRSSF